MNAGDGRSHVHLYKRTGTALAVPMLWQPPVPCAGRGMLLAILAPVLGMLGGPALLAVALVGPGIGGGGHFCAVPLGVSRPLAVRVRTETLRLRTGIWHKETLAMDTAHLAGHGFLLREAVSQYVALTGSRSTTTTADAEGNTG